MPQSTWPWSGDLASAEETEELSTTKGLHYNWYNPFSIPPDLPPFKGKKIKLKITQVLKEMSTSIYRLPRPGLIK